MSAPIRNPKDFWAGALFLALGAAFAGVVLVEGYELGSARKMGPGYYPIWLAGGLCLIGLALLWRGLATFGSPLGRLALKPLLLVTAATVLFGAIVNVAGLAPAIVLMVLVTAYASDQFSLGYAVPLAAGLAVFSVLVFVKGLGVPVPIMPHVLGY